MINLTRVLISAGVVACCSGALFAADNNGGVDINELVRRYAASLSWKQSESMQVRTDNEDSDGTHDRRNEFTYRRDGDRVEVFGQERDFPSKGAAVPDTSTSLSFSRLASRDFFLYAAVSGEASTVWRSRKHERLDENRNFTLTNDTWGSFLDGSPGGYGNQGVAGVLSLCQDLHAGQQTEKIDGTNCYVVDGTSPYGAVKVWIAPDKGYNALRYELHRGENDSYDKTTVGGQGVKDLDVVVDGITLEKIGDTYVPVAGRMTEKMVYKDGTVGNMTITCTRSNVQLNPDFAALHAFEIHLPEGIRVIDEDAPGILFKFRGGKIIPAVDDAMVDEIDKTMAAVASGTSAVMATSAASALSKASHPLHEENHVFLWIIGVIAAMALIGMSVVLWRSKRPENL